MRLRLDEFNSVVTIVARVFFSNTLCFYIYKTSNGQFRCLRSQLLDDIMTHYGVDYTDKSAITRLNCKSFAGLVDAIKVGRFAPNEIYEFTDESVNDARVLLGINDLCYRVGDEQACCSEIVNALEAHIESKKKRPARTVRKDVYAVLHDVDSNNLGIIKAYRGSGEIVLSERSNNTLTFIRSDDISKFDTSDVEITLNAKIIANSKSIKIREFTSSNDKAPKYRTWLYFDFELDSKRYTGRILLGDTGLQTRQQFVKYEEIGVPDRAISVKLAQKLLNSGLPVFKDCKFDDSSVSKLVTLDSWLRDARFILCKAYSDFCFVDISNPYPRLMHFNGGQVNVKCYNDYILASDLAKLGKDKRDVNVICECSLTSDNIVLEVLLTEQNDDSWYIVNRLLACNVVYNDGKVEISPFIVNLRRNYDGYFSNIEKHLKSSVNLEKYIPYSQVGNIPLSDKKSTADALLYKFDVSNKESFSSNRQIKISPKVMSYMKENQNLLNS